MAHAAQSSSSRSPGRSSVLPTHAPETAPAPFSSSRLRLLLLALLPLAAFLPALRAGFIWDDDDYVTQNLTLRSLEGLRRIWFELGATPQYYPLVHTTFWIEHALWGLAPMGYHAVNIMLHTASVLLLFWVLRGLGVPGAWLGAALFAVHPVQTESVAWITERKNVLSGVLYLGALLAYLRFLALRGETALQGFAASALPPRLSGSGAAYAAALLLFLGALFSKTVVITFPAAVLVLLWWKRPSGCLTLRDGIPLLPFLLLGIGLGLVTVWMEKHNVGAQGAEWALAPAERWLVAGRALWFYAAKLLWPHPLVFIYPRWKLDAAQLSQHLFPVAAVAAMGLLFVLRGRIGRGPLAGVLLFAGTLFPALGFFDVYPFRYSFVADHFQYHASAALLALFAAGLALLTRSLPMPARTAGGAGLVLVLGALTWNQCGIYRNLETLWRDTLAKNPTAGMAHNNRGNLLTQRGEFDSAIRHYEEALKLEPRDDYAHYNYGVALLHQGKPEAAIRRFREALKINPNYPDAYFNWGKILDEQGRSREALEAYERGLRLRPNDPRGHMARALALVNLNRGEEAVAAYRRAVELAPHDGDILFNFSALLLGLERPAEAIPLLERAVRLNPQDTQARAALEAARRAPRR